MCSSQAVSAALKQLQLDFPLSPDDIMQSGPAASDGVGLEARPASPAKSPSHTAGGAASPSRESMGVSSTVTATGVSCGYCGQYLVQIHERMDCVCAVRARCVCP